MFVLLLLLLVASAAAVGDELKFFNDRLLYSISFLSHDQLAGVSPEVELVPLKSADQENYQCLLPEINFSGDTRIQSYSGPSPAKIIESLHKTKECALRIEPFWIYEVCAGKSIRQFHEEKTTKAILEFSLGNFYHVAPWEQTIEKFDPTDLPKIEVGGTKLAYYPVLYKNGTKCDLTGEPRSTTVIHVCDERTMLAVISFSEISTCTYEIVVGTSLLCTHPSFAKPKAEQFEIKCFAATAKTPVRPAAYDQFADDLRFDDFSEVLEKRAGIKRPKVVTLEELAASLPHSRTSIPAIIKGALSQKGDTIRMLVKLVEDFFGGRRCLHGGAGWWRFEACYKKHVLHFHDDKETGERTKVMLGRYSEKIQRDWAKANHKRVREFDDEGAVAQVTNVYTQGQVCEETGKPRTVQMKLSCLLEENLLKSLTLRSKLVETDTCEYVLLIESGLFCSYLQQTDQFGLYKEDNLLEYMPLLLDALKNMDAKEFFFVKETRRDTSGEEEDVEEEAPKRTAKTRVNLEDLRHAAPVDP